MLSSKGSGCGPIGLVRHRVDCQSVINAFADFSVRRLNNPLIEQRQAREIRKAPCGAHPAYYSRYRWTGLLKDNEENVAELVNMNRETLGVLGAVIGLGGGRAVLGLAMLISILAIEMIRAHGLAVL
jgi:hypothetical protein